MKIAGIGWGSLVWKPGELRCVGPWHEDGPALPLEFARTSRDGRLTLVLCEGTALVPSLWSQLDYLSPEVARAALAAREGCDLATIGLWSTATPGHGVGAELVAAWALANKFDAVVWTALPPKFHDVRGLAPETAEVAVEYLKKLDPRARELAREYVERAPAQIRTQFREAFELHLGWSATA